SRPGERQRRRYVVHRHADGVGGAVGAIFVGGGGADRITVGTVGVGVKHGVGVAGHRLDATVAPDDGPAGNGVLTGLGGRERQRVGRGFIDRGSTGEGQGRCDVVDVDGDGVARAVGAVLVGRRGADRVVVGAVGVGVRRCGRVAVHRLRDAVA